MDKARLSDVAALLDMQVTAAQAKLRKVCLREDRLLHHLRTLDAQRARTNMQTAHEELTMAAFQNDLHLRRWADQRRASVNTELAQVRALIAIARAEVQHHYARQQALAKVADRIAQMEREALARKADYGS